MRPADAESTGQSESGGATPETEKALQWLQRSSAQEELIGAVSQQVRRRRFAVVSSACFGLVAAAIVWRSSLPAPASPEDSRVALEQTATVSAPARQVLPDGTIVELKEGASITHVYTAEQRSVTLLRGEAHFQVAKNPARPFVVTAGGVAVRAVGTAFSVQFGATAVEVLVTEGEVAVQKTGAGPEPAAGAEPALLQARDHALIRHAEFVPEVSSVAETDLVRRLAWRVPQLEFSRTPLSEVITLMNQHGGTAPPIVPDLPAAEMAQMKLSGFLAADNVEGLVRLLEANFPVTAKREADVMRLRKKPD